MCFVRHLDGCGKTARRCASTRESFPTFCTKASTGANAHGYRGKKTFQLSPKKFCWRVLALRLATIRRACRTRRKIRRSLQSPRRTRGLRGVQAAVANGSFVRGLTKSGTAKWESEFGGHRRAAFTRPGVANAQTAYAKWFSRLICRCLPG